MKKTAWVLGVSLFVAGAAQATTINFTEFDNGDGVANGLLVDGLTTDWEVVKSTVDVDGVDQFLYSVTYTGADYDGDSSNDTLTFDLRVAGMAGNTVSSGFADGTNQTGTDGSVTLDGSAVSVGTTGTGFVVGDTNMGNGDTLIFTVENLLVSVAGYSATFDGFDAVRLFQTSGTGNSHVGVIGAGTGLYAEQFGSNTALESELTSEDPLYVSSDITLATSPTRQYNWAVDDLDFNVTVIPEPATIGMLGLGAIVTFMVRKQQRG
jgi:hypothetical protein